MRVYARKLTGAIPNAGKASVVVFYVGTHSRRNGVPEKTGVK